MALYAIGDVQGCYDPLRRLLDKVRFDPANDTLWFTGDLVNRGPGSADVLRLVKGLEARAIAVLGNHDLHLLAIAAGANRPARRDTLDDVLHAPDRDELLAWLAQRPLLHRDTAARRLLVHAGLLPQWDVELAEACAREAEAVLRDERAPEFFQHMYGDEPNVWRDTLTGWSRLRLIVNAFTRLRYCTAEGRIDFAHKAPPGTQPAYLSPWFAVPARRSTDHTVIFGHWSLLGRYDGYGVIGVDTGCVWGHQLTAVRLTRDEGEFASVPCKAGP